MGQRTTIKIGLVTILSASCALAWARAPQSPTPTQQPVKPIQTIPSYLKGPVQITRVAQAPTRYTAQAACSITPEVSVITAYDSLGGPIHPSSVAAITDEQFVFFDDPESYPTVFANKYNQGKTIQAIDLEEDPPMLTIGSSSIGLGDLSLGPGAQFAGCATQSYNNQYYSSVYTFDIYPYQLFPFIQEGNPSICWGTDADASNAYLLAGSGHEQWLLKRHQSAQQQTELFNLDTWDIAAYLNEVVSFDGSLFFSMRYSSGSISIPDGEAIVEWRAGWDTLEEIVDFGTPSVQKRPLKDLEAFDSGVVGLRPGTVYYPYGYDSSQTQWIAPKLELISPSGNYCTINFNNQPWVDQYSDWADIDVINIDADTIDVIVVDRRIRRTEANIDYGYAPVLHSSEHSNGGGRLLRITVDLPTGY